MDTELLLVTDESMQVLEISEPQVITELQTFSEYLGGEPVLELLDLTSAAELVEAAVQGPPGPPGPAGANAVVVVGGAPISGHSVVALDASGYLVCADCTNAAHLGAVLGVVADAYAAGAQAVVQTDFELSHTGWTFAPGPVFVGEAGLLTQSVPAGAVFTQVVGFALSPTRLRVSVIQPIVSV